MRLALGFALACAALLAQPTFRHLATTDDGSRLYFSSSSGEIFVFGPQGLELFAQDGDEPSVSGNAQIVAFNGASQSSLALGSGAVFWTAAGRAVISRNARFALFASEATATVLDLGSLRSHTAGLQPAARSLLGIASDGTAVIPGPGTIQIVRASGVTSYPAQGAPASAVIDDRAATVAYEAQGRIILLDLLSGAESVAAEPGVQPRLSNDGQLLLYLAPDVNGVQQAWIGSRQLTSEEPGVTEAVLSGDGTLAYAVVNFTRILRIDVASGQIGDMTAAMTPAASGRPRVVSLTAASGQLCYHVENAANISIQPDFGIVPGPSACLTARPSMTTTYTLTATNDSGSATASATVEGTTSVRITSFTNDPPYSPIAGGPVTLSWTTQKAVSVTITGLGLPRDPAPLNGSVIVTPVTNTSYTLTAYGATGQAVSSVLYVFVR